MSFLSEEKRVVLNDFIGFVRTQLGIKTMPTISLLNHRNGFKTTANYDYSKENKIIKISTLNRAIVDISRSIAHELVHHKQWEDGRLKVKPPDIGGEIEDEANAKAGQYIKIFGKRRPEIYEL